MLIDTPPDLREQLLDARVATLDGVLFTHDHADHTHGIDDLRGVFFNTQAPRARLGRCGDARDPGGALRLLLRQPPGLALPADPAGARHPPARARAHRRPGGTHRGRADRRRSTATAPSLGFRFGDVAYSPDISGIPESSMPLLQGLDLWIVDALRPVPHPSHFSVKQALAWIERLGVKRAILTHMTVELDYEALRRQLPPNVEPGYDGMVVEVD